MNRRLRFSLLLYLCSLLVFCAILWLLPVVPAAAQDTLPTPRANGELLFSATFDQGANGFAAAYGDQWMRFEITGGLARVWALAPDTMIFATNTGLNLTDLIMEADINAVTLRADADFGFVLRYRGGNDERFYSVTMEPAIRRAHFDRWDEQRDDWVYLAQVDIPSGVFDSNGFNRLRVELVGDECTAFLNGVFLLRGHDSTLTQPGGVGLAVSAPDNLMDGEKMLGEFDNVRIYLPAASQPSSQPSQPAASGGSGATTGATATVTASGLNVRSGAGVSYTRLGSVARGSVLPVLGRNEACTWINAETPVGIGWVSASYVTLSRACSELPVIGASSASAAAQATPSQPASGGATAQPTPSQPSGATAGPSSSLITDFEVFGTWRRGDEAFGEFVRSGEQVFGGSGAGKLTYDFPADAPGGRNYVLFRRTISIAGQPGALEMQVYGDGSGNFLNTWVQDATGQIWQFSFGQIRHAGWKKMRAPLDTSLNWPVQPVGGEATELVYPIKFYAVVLDYPDNEAASGTIYLDDLAATAQ